jgi:hypothetical protein
MASKTSHQRRTALDEKKQPIRLDLDTFTPPAVGIQDLPNRCYRLNHEWAKIIMGFASMLTDIRGWDGAVDESHPGIIGVETFLVGEDCGMTECPDVEICLQTSPLISVIVAVSFATQEAATQAHLDELATLYDGTPQSVGSEIPLTAPNLDARFDNALCRTMELLAAVYGNGKAISLFLLSDFAESYQNMIAATRNLWGFGTPWLMHLLGSEISSCAADVDTAIAALTDETAQLEYACCLYDELRSAVISEANWNTALATCAASLSGNAGVIACLMDFDNDQSHALAFFEVYSRLIERQADGTDFVCECVPDGWFWLDVPWEWSEPTHSGFRESPVFSHTNPSNGELFSITAMVRSDNSGKQRITIKDSGLTDNLVIGTPLLVRPNLWLWEDAFVGVMEGADAVGWPAAQRWDINMKNPKQQPGATFSVIWRDGVDLGHTASIEVTRVRLLYKDVP